MVNPALIPAIQKTIRENEIGDASPYVLSFAELGKSGASFGFMQGDTNVSDLARTTLRRALVEADLDGPTIDRIMTALSRPLPHGNPLAPPDLAAANQALSSPAGRPLVDAMDVQLLSGVMTGLDQCTAAANTRSVSLAPIANLYIAPWINMTGPPSLLVTWLRGATALGLSPPSPPLLTELDMQAYLQATSYFQNHLRNFAHLLQCVGKGAEELPA
jgi:hypothetical protein